MRFVKYSGSGNDFLIFTSCVRDNGSRANLAQKVCHRHNGIGADGMIVLLPFATNDYEYEWEFYNTDGSKANMCGNASRVIGHYAYSEGIAGQKHRFLSQAGVINIQIDSQNPLKVQSDLGCYKVLNEHIEESNPYGVSEFVLLDTGVPHLVGFVSKLEDLPQNKDTLLVHWRHSYNANVNLAYIDSGQKIFFITYERGVEEITLACGTGAAAVFAQAFKKGLVNEQCALIPPSQERLELTMGADSHILFQGEIRRIALCEWFGD